MFGIPEEVEAGQLLQVSCTVTKGDEPVTIQWLKDELPLISSPQFRITSISSKMSILMLEDVGFEHSGLYSCVAYNPVGKAEEASPLKVKGEF